APDLRDRGYVEVEALRLVHVRARRVAQDVEALRVRLHEPVLDAVVNHLHEVAGAGGPRVHVAAFRRERLEDRLEALHDGLVAAHHEAVAALEAPDPAARADVDIVDAKAL